MTADKLKKIILDEIGKNPGIYRKAIAPALAESELSSSEIMSGYAELAGVELSKTQLRWLDQHDAARARREAENQKRMQRLPDWRSAGKQIYGLGDFPKWLIENMNMIFGSAKETLREAASEIMDSKPDSFPPGMEDTPEQFCVLPYGTFFTKEGYQYLLMTAQSRKWVTQDEWIRWKKESGLFDSHLKESA